jgi:hypothetical protein
VYTVFLAALLFGSPDIWISWTLDWRKRYGGEPGGEGLSTYMRVDQAWYTNCVTISPIASCSYILQVHCLLRSSQPPSWSP